MNKIKQNYHKWKKFRKIKNLADRLHYVEDCLRDVECMLKDVHMHAENSSDFIPLAETARLRVGIRRVLLKELKDLKQQIEELNARIEGLLTGKDV